MAYTQIYSGRWGGNVEPYIDVTVWYDLRRSGAVQQYRFKTTVARETTTSYFGYPIYQDVTLDGTKKDSKTLKSASPSQFAAITYETGWIDVANKTTGTTALALRLYSGSGSSRTQTITFSLPISPAASVINTFAAFDVDAGCKVSYTKYDSSFTQTLVIKCGSTAVKTITGYISGAAISFTTGERAEIYSLMSSVKSASFTATLTTYSGTASLGTSSKTATGSINNANPVFPVGNVSYQDTNANTTALTGNNQQVIQMQSTLAVTVAAATAQKGASLVNYTVSFGSVNRVITAAGTVDFGKVNVAANTNLTVTATDSRGNKTTVTLPVTVLAWTKPTLTVSAARINGYEATTKIKATAKYSGLNGLNTLSLSYRYSADGNTWSEWAALTNGVESQVELDQNSSYTIQAKAEDVFDSAAASTTVNIGVAILFIGKNTLAVAINGFPDGTNKLTVHGNTKFNGSIAIGDNPLADYIVEHGVTGSWTYRKYASGDVIMEYGGDITFPGLDNASGIGIDGYYVVGVDVALPVTLAHKWCVPVCSTNWVYAEWVQAGILDTGHIKIRKFANGNGIRNTTNYVSIVVHGKWK